MPKAYNGNNTKKQGKNYKFLPWFFVALYRPVCPIGHIVYLWTWTVRYRDFFLDISTPYTVRPRSYWTHSFKSKIKFFLERGCSEGALFLHLLREVCEECFIPRRLWLLTPFPYALHLENWIRFQDITVSEPLWATWKRPGQASLRRRHGKIMVLSSG